MKHWLIDIKHTPTKGTQLSQSDCSVTNCWITVSRIILEDVQKSPQRLLVQESLTEL